MVASISKMQAFANLLSMGLLPSWLPGKVGMHRAQCNSSMMEHTCWTCLEIFIRGYAIYNLGKLELVISFFNGEPLLARM